MVSPLIILDPNSIRGRHHPHRAAFTFTEVLFAVMLLGIGFIMVAAIFPVAIQQSQNNREDAMGAIVASEGIRVIKNINFSADELMLQSGSGRNDGRVHLFDDYRSGSKSAMRYSKIVGNLINRSDPRYAWVPLGYKIGPAPVRDGNSYFYPPPLYYEVYVAAVACRNKSTYEESDLVPGGTFTPKPCAFVLSEGNTGPDLIGFSNPRASAAYAPYDEPAAAEGACVIVADDQVPTSDPLRGHANGRVYRLGIRRPDLGTGVFELAPGNDMAINGNINENLPPGPIRPAGKLPTGTTAKGFIIGRGYADPSKPSPTALLGPAQELFVTSTIVFFPIQ